MTLSLDDVRNKRFRMARKGGYEVLEVDEFVDEVEESFGQLVEENASLKKQVDALRSASSDSTAEPVATELQTTEVPQTNEVAPPQAAAEQPVDVVGSEQSAQPVESTPAPAFQPVVVTTSAEASTAVVRLVQLSTEQAEHLVNEAAAEAGRIREDAARDASQVTEDAHTRAERLESDARVKAESVQSDAQNRSESLDRELSQRRTELFSDLDRQRDQLTNTVGRLRSFEQQYRTNLHEHLRGQLDSLEHVDLEPEGGPERTAPVVASTNVASTNGVATNDVATNDAASHDAAGEPSSEGAPVVPEPDHTDGGGADGSTSTSATPRLDALLGEQH